MVVAVNINPNTPYGLQPMRRLDGARWNDSLRRYFIPASSATAFYVGDPVVKVTGSADVNGVNGIALATAGTTNKITGAICGFLGYCTAGTGNVPSMYGAPVGPMYVPASQAVDWYALVNDDPETQFMIQADANFGGVLGTAITPASVGKNINLKSGVGSPFTGWSGWQADSNSIAVTVGFQFNIIGFHTDAQNLANAQFQKLIVRANTHTETNLQVGI
jgi:hypothetical protein